MDKPNIACIACGQYEANCYLVSLEGRDDLIVIDPGDDWAHLKKSINQTGRRVSDVLLTHGHFDHMLSAHHLMDAGARVRIHPADGEMLGDAAASLYNPTACMDAFVPATADAPFDAAETAEMALCGLRFTLTHTPGHTLGGMCFHLRDHGVIFTGDTLFRRGIGRTDFPGGSAMLLRQSIRKLLALPPETIVYPGHGPSTRIGREAGSFL